tara:strand:- start:480 stop:2393 length:1914 start_codon:yes stop_codon:yes gene_type:complete
MFRVHQPAHSYFKKQLRTYGSAELLMALEPHLLLKAAFLHYLPGGENNVGRQHNWGPVDEEGNPIGLSSDLHTPDHPPWSHNPDTGKLIYDPTTKRAWGHHPIDYVHHDLQRKLNIGPEASKEIINQAIDRFRNNSGKDLPGFDDPRWRKVFFWDGGHTDETVPSRNRPVFAQSANGMPEGIQPLITYSLNEGNVNHDLADQGRWLDGGLVHFHHELGEVLQQKLLESGMSPEAIQGYVDQAYVRDGTLKPHHLTQGGPNGQHLVGSWGKNDMIESEKSGSVPHHFMLESVKDSLSQQRSHDDVHAHQLTSVLPDGFFHAPTGGLGGRGKTKDKMSMSEDGLKLAKDMQDMGIDISPYAQKDENGNITYPRLDTIANTKAMKMLTKRTHNIFGTAGKDKQSGGAVKSALKSTFASILPEGTILEDLRDNQRFRNIASHAKGAPAAHGSFADTANKRAAEIVQIKNFAIHQLMQSKGMSEDEARKEIVNRFRTHEYQANRHAPQEGLREETEKIVQAMMGHTGHEAYQMGPLATHRVSSGLPDGLGQHTEMPEGWAKRRVSAEHLPIQPVMPPTQRVVQQPMAAAPTGLPFGVGAPSDVSDLYQQQSPLFQTSDDIIMHGLDDIRKKMGYFDGFLRGF